MKNINIKKVVAGAAALAVGASFLGAAVAAQVQAEGLEPIVKNDIIGANGMPTGTIVVGSMAQPADVIWAGNIAAAIGAKAYTTTEHTTEDVIVPGQPGSAVSISGDGYLEDTYTIEGGVIDVTMNKDNYSLLHETDISADSDFAGDSTLRVFDELKVNGSVFFETDRDIKDLVFNVARGQIQYKIDLDSGLKVGYNDNDVSPSFRFKLMGTEYTVDSINTAGNTIKLIANKNTITYQPNEEFMVDEYKVKVVEILDTGAQNNRYEASLQLINAQGTVVTTGVYRSNSSKIFSNYLTSSVTVDTVYSTSVKIVSGSSTKLELRNTSRIKDFPNIGDEMWKATFTQDGNYVKSITLETDHADLDFVNKKGLKVGDKVELPNDFGTIEFLGLTDETMSEFKVADGKIYFQDDARKSNEIFFYDYSTFTTARNDWTTNEELNGKRLYIKSHGDAAKDYNVTIQQDNDSGRYLQDNGTWSTTLNYINGDYNTNAYIPLTIELPSSTEKVKYGLYLVTSDSNASANAADVNMTHSITQKDNKFVTAIIGLESGDNNYAVGRTKYQWEVDGVDVDPKGAAYVKTGSKVIGAFPGTNGASSTATTATQNPEKNYFGLYVTETEKDTEDIKFYIDSYTGDFVNVGSNDFTDAVKPVEYSTFALSDEGNNTDLEMLYTKYGAEISIEDGYVLAHLPERQRNGKVFIGGGSQTVIEEGQPGSTIPGTTYTTITPANIDVRNLVKMDNAGVGGVKIIVGGHLVNTLAQGITDDYLTQAGQWVLGKNTEGNMVVAGFTAQDTADAAGALISIIMG